MTKSNQQQSLHVAVMVQEAMEALMPRPGGRYLDATLGGATHSRELLKLSAPDGQVLSLDVDPVALARAREQQSAYGGRWHIAESNFRYLRQEAERSGLAPFDGILFDLGLSSDELADASKGLSFQTDGPLDMRLGPKSNEDELTAADIVNGWTESELTELFRVYGEEKFAYRIAKGIVERRRRQNFLTTTDLAEFIKDSVPSKREKIHPATRVFQALRIAVNDELAALRQALGDADELLAPGGTIAVISFHSLEDRIVKNIFKQYKNYKVSKKPLCPSETELKNNIRARSAKLRAAHKNTSKLTYVEDVRPGYD